MDINEDFTSRAKLEDIGRWYVTRFVQNVAGELAPGVAVLDAGAGECAYKRYFAHCNYKAIDLALGEPNWNYSHLDYIGPLDRMPIPDAAFDVVLCTQVLEHLEHPQESIVEMFRVLRPGGRLYMTVPMAHPEHQVPYDFFRYTSYGLRSLCQIAGFSEIRTEAFGGFLTRWAYEAPRILSILPRARTPAGHVKLTAILIVPCRYLLLGTVRLLQRFLLALDRFDARRDDPFGWACVATKSVLVR